EELLAYGEVLIFRADLQTTAHEGNLQARGEVHGGEAGSRANHYFMAVNLREYGRLNEVRQKLLNHAVVQLELPLLAVQKILRAVKDKLQIDVQPGARHGLQLTDAAGT